MYENNKGINIMKKIAILLLLAFSSFLVASELAACKRGVDAREMGVGDIKLLVTGDEHTIAGGGNACAFYKDPVKDVRKRAACIFGYNTNIPQNFSRSTRIPGNGCDPGNMFTKPCPENWDRRCDNGNATCCVCGYENEPATLNKPEVYGVCKYGSEIGWNLSRVTESTLGNYFYNGTTRDYEGNPVNAIGRLWGRNSNITEGILSQTNWLNYIRVYVNNIKEDGSNNIFSKPVVTVSGADAVRLAW